jgi:hypothetical protein
MNNSIENEISEHLADLTLYLPAEQRPFLDECEQQTQDLDRTGMEPLSQNSRSF